MSEEAAAHGIRPGMMVAQARALCAHVQLIEHEPHRDAVALEAIARWLLRFTPIVSLGWAVGDGQSAGSASTAHHPPPTAHRVQSFCQGERLFFQGAAAHPRDQLRVKSDPQSEIADRQSAIFLDLTGCQHVFGGYRTIVDQIMNALHRFGVRAGVVVAPTVGAAYALSCDVRWSGAVFPPLPVPRERSKCDWLTALDRLPPVTLRIGDEIAAALTHLGIASIALLRRLPRHELPARFGPLLLKRLDQAMGVEPEPLVPIRPIEPIENGVEYDFGVDSIESLWGVIDQQLDQMLAQLIRRGHGARVIEFDLLLLHHAPITRTIELSRPTRDRKRIRRLIKLSLEQAAQPRKGRNRTRARDLFGARFAGVRFRVTQSIRIRDEQIALLDRDHVSDEIAIADLLERLSLRLKEGVAQAQLVEAYVPERSWASSHPLPVLRTSASSVEPERAGVRAERQLARRNKKPSPYPLPEYREREQPLRPLHFNEPQEIAVIVSPSHDRDGRPVAVTLGGAHQRVIHARGPERIAGQWWTGHTKTRDYFDIELEDAVRLWVFRVVENGRWFVQGEY